VAVGSGFGIAVIPAGRPRPPPGAPARPCPPAAPAAPGDEVLDVDADPAQQRHPGVGDQSGLAAELHLTARHHGVGERHAETAGEMVVAGARRPQRRVARTDAGRPP